MAGRGSKAFGRIADWFIPGNAYNSTTSRWNPATTKTGIAGVIADQFVPGGSNIVGIAANSGLFGSDFATQLRNEGIYNTMADQYGDFRAGLKSQYLDPAVDVGGGYNPQVSVGGPQAVSIGSYAPQHGMPTMPPVESQAPWNPLGTQTGNVFNGGALGSWANGSTPQGRQIGGNLSFGGGSYNNGVGAGTGFGAANYANDAWGDVASSFGVGGMAGGSRDQVMSSDGPRGLKKRI